VRLRINGEVRDLENVATIRDIVRLFNLDQRIIIVEHNQVIIDRESYDDTIVSEDDQIEIVHFVGGG